MSNTADLNIIMLMSKYNRYYDTLRHIWFLNEINWSNNIRDTNIKGDQIEVVTILKGYENTDSNIFSSKLTQVK